jgi:hypothetical protein
MSAPAPTSQLLKYADDVEVNVAPQQVNLVDLDSYGHRVIISVLTSVMNSTFSWSRAANTARPVGHFTDSNGSFQASLASAMNTLYIDTDAVANKLSFDSSALTLNPDPRVREGGQVSANDLMMAYVLYKVYGSSFASTEEIVFNLQDAHGMLTSADYAAAIVAAFNNSESQTNASGNEKGAVDAMFRDLLAADSLRFFDASGNQVPGLFETNTDTSSSGTWNLVAGDKIEVRTSFTFLNSVTLRTSTDVAQNLNPLPNQANDETIYIAAGSKLSIRLQITASNTGASGEGGGSSIPGIPLNVSATPGDAQIAMTWSAPSSNGGSAITGYNVYRNGSLVTTTAAQTTSYTITGLSNGTSYNITIKAVNNAGSGPASSAVSSTPSAGGGGGTVPDTPANVLAIGGDCHISIEWDYPTDTSIISYDIYTTDFGVINVIAPAASYALINLTNGVTYGGIYVRAINAAGQSAPSPTFSATAMPTQFPPTPSGFTTSVNGLILTLSWDTPTGTPSVEGYNIYIDGTIYSSIGLITNTTITDLAPGNYSVALTATNSVGESAQTEPPVSITILRPPDAPTNVAVTPDDTQITISWDAPTDASVTSHNIYTDAWGTINVAAPATSHTLGATNGVTYTGIYVKAVNAASESLASATFSVTPGPTSPPNTPTGFTSYLNISIYTLSWDGPSGLPSVQGYNIYINGSLYTSMAPSATYAQIPNLVPGITYNMTLAATNTIGESDPTSPISITPQNLPRYPDILNITPYNSRLYLSWLATGQTLSAYKVYLSTTASFTGSPVATVSGTTLSADIDLTNVPEFADGVWYGLVITAVDANGLESIKQAVVGFAATTSPLPSPVNMLTATPMDSSISVTWSEPIYAGATPPILSYTVYVLDQTNGSSWPITGITGLSTIIPSLTNGRNYTINVTAVSADGESPLATTYTGYIGELNAMPGTTPGNPENITATRGDESFVVSWTPPSYTGVSGGPISGYKVYVGTDTGINAPVILSAASRSYTATGLTNNTSYSIRVSAVSSDGESFDIGAQVSATPNVLPAAPSVSVAAIDSGLVIGWTPTANNAVVDSYVLYINGSMVTYIDATLRSIIIRPLTNGTSYDVRVSGYNSIGEGPLSTVTAGTPAPASPGPIIVSGALAAYIGTVPSTLTFGASVTAISATAFADPVSGAAPTNLASVNLASTSITALPAAIFSGCSGLTSVTVPPTLTSIGSQAFNGCANLSTINLSSTSVTMINTEAFQSCAALTSISLPASLTSIGDNTFQGCSNLVSINLSATGITSLGGIFNGCASLASVLLPTGLLAIGGTFNSLSALTSLVIPSGVTSIAASAFSNCTSLSSVNLPSGLLSLGNTVFNGCSALTSIVIPSAITSIGLNTFAGCTSLTLITLPSGLVEIGPYSFSGCAITSITIPSGVINIGQDAFQNCAQLQSVILPAGLQTLANSVFFGCTALTSMILPSGVPFLNDFTFFGCSSLTSLTLSASLTGIGISVFDGCSALTSVRIPASFNMSTWTANLAAAGYTGTIIQV